MKKEITIPREWLERLIEISDNLTLQKDRENDWLQFLLGYIKSAKFLLKDK